MNFWHLADQVDCPYKRVLKICARTVFVLSFNKYLLFFFQSESVDKIPNQTLGADGSVCEIN